MNGSHFRHKKMIIRNERTIIRSASILMTVGKVADIFTPLALCFSSSHRAAWRSSSLTFFRSPEILPSPRPPSSIPRRLREFVQTTHSFGFFLSSSPSSSLYNTCNERTIIRSAFYGCSMTVGVADIRTASALTASAAPSRAAWRSSLPTLCRSPEWPSPRPPSSIPRATQRELFKRPILWFCPCLSPSTMCAAF